MTGKCLRKKIMVVLFAAALPFVLVSCAEKKQEERPRTAPVSTAMAVQKDIPLEIKAIGEIEALSSAAVRPQVSGPVTKVHFTEGQFVRKGDMLFTIDPRPFEVALKQAKAQLAKDRAQYEKALADANRYEELVSKGYVAEAEYEQFRTAAEALRSVVDADRAVVENARLELAYCFIRAPFSGKTGTVAFDRGNIVRTGDAAPLVTIYQVAPIYVSFTVPEQSLPAIRGHMTGRALKVTVEPVPGAVYEGGLSFIDNAVDRSTGTIRLKGTLKNRDSGLWPGQFVNVTLRLDIQKNAVVVPSEAVMTGQNGQYVFAVTKDLSAEMRPVSVDRTHGEETVIKSGINPGETVVVSGQLQLTPGMKVQVKEPAPADNK